MSEPDQPPADGAAGPYFALFTEIAIIEQLARARLEACLPAGFLQSHFGVLLHLARGRDGATPLDLARAFQVPKTTMSHTLAGLHRHGLVRFAGNPRDGRSKRVFVTDAGRAFRDAAIATMQQDMAPLAAAFPPDQAAALLPALRRLRETLDALRDAEP